MKTVLLVLILASLPLPSATAQAPSPPGSPEGRARVVRVLPVREWMQPTKEPVVPPLGSFLGLSARSDEQRPLLLRVQGERLLGPQAMEQALRDYMPALQQMDVDLRFLRSSLVLTGAAEAVQQVEEAVRILTAAMAHPVRLDATLYRAPADRTFPATASREELGRITRDLDAVWSATTSCASGAATGLGVEELTPYVYDFDVEVAEKSDIGDPKVTDLFQGVRLAAQPHVLTGSSDLVLFAQFAFGRQQRPLETRASGVQDMPALEVPQLQVASGVCSARVPDGGAVLVAVQGVEESGGNMLLALSATRTRPPGETGEIGVLPVSALLTNALESRSGTALFDTLQTTPVVFGAGVVEDPRAGALRDAGDLEQILRDASPGFEEAEVLEVRGGHLFVRGSDGLVAAAAEIVRGLQDTWLRTVRVEATTTLHPAPAGDELFASGGRGAEGVLHRVTFPALLGRTHVVARGTETTGIRDYDVEIAQKAAVANAIVEGVFSGVAVEAFVHAGLRDTGAEVDIGLVYVPEPRRRAVEMREGGDRFVAAPRRAFFRHAGGVSPGEVIDLGEGPIVEVHGQSFRTRQHLRIGPR